MLDILVISVDIITDYYFIFHSIMFFIVCFGLFTVAVPLHYF